MSEKKKKPGLVNGQALPNELQSPEGTTEEDLLNKKKGHDKEACADLEKITDYAEDKEISEQNIGDAINIIEDKRSVEKDKKTAREKELAQVKIKKEDLELIVTEMEVSLAVAERTLRETGGNVVEALIKLTD